MQTYTLTDEMKDEAIARERAVSTDRAIATPEYRTYAAALGALTIADYRAGSSPTEAQTQNYEELTKATNRAYRALARKIETYRASFDTVMNTARAEARTALEEIKHADTIVAEEKAGDSAQLTSNPHGVIYAPIVNIEGSYYELRATNRDNLAAIVYVMTCYHAARARKDDTYLIVRGLNSVLWETADDAAAPEPIRLTPAEAELIKDAHVWSRDAIAYYRAANRAELSEVDPMTDRQILEYALPAALERMKEKATAKPAAQDTPEPIEQTPAPEGADTVTTATATAPAAMRPYARFAAITDQELAAHIETKKGIHYWKAGANEYRYNGKHAKRPETIELWEDGAHVLTIEPEGSYTVHRANGCITPTITRALIAAGIQTSERNEPAPAPAPAPEVIEQTPAPANNTAPYSPEYIAYVAAIIGWNRLKANPPAIGDTRLDNMVAVHNAALKTLRTAAGEMARVMVSCCKRDVQWSAERPADSPVAAALAAYLAAPNNGDAYQAARAALMQAGNTPEQADAALDATSPTIDALYPPFTIAPGETYAEKSAAIRASAPPMPETITATREHTVPKPADLAEIDTTKLTEELKATAPKRAKKAKKGDDTPAPAVIEQAPAPAPEPIQVLGSTLAAALAAVRPAVATKTALPILSAVKLTRRGDNLEVMATNLEIAARQHIPTATGADLAVTVDHKALADTVKNCREMLTIELDATDPKKQRAIITSGKTKRTLPAYDSADYPIIPGIMETAASIEIPALDLMRLISRTAPAAAKDDSRPVLSGIRLQAKEGELTAAAADGFRMHYTISETRSAEDFYAIAPARIIKALTAMKPSGNVHLTVSKTGSALTIAQEGKSVLSRLIEGTFPDVMQIIPREYAGYIELDRLDTLAAVKRLHALAKNNNDVMRISRPDEDGAVKFSATSAEEGYDEVILTATNTSGEVPPVIAFNCQYFAESLTVLEGSTFRLSLNNPNQAGVISNDYEQTQIVIMPMVIGADK